MHGDPLPDGTTRSVTAKDYAGATTAPDERPYQGRVAETMPYTDTAPKAGDEAVAFTVTPGQDGALVGPTKAVVFRRGSTIAQFSTENPSATAPTDDFDFPIALIEAQDAKLG